MYSTDFLGVRVLNTFRNVTALGASNLYCALFINSPGKSGTAGTEISYIGYTRPEIIFGVPFAENNAMNTRNTNDLLWAVAPTDVGTARFIGISDSPTPGSGNMWLFGELTVPLEIRANQQPSIYAGDVLYFITGNYSNAFMTRILNLLRNQNIAGFEPHLALFNADPEAAGAELSGGAYARPPIAFNAPAAQPGGQQQIQNTAIVRFPTPTTTWGLWAWDVLMDAVTGNNLIVKMQNPSPETLQVNYVPMVNAGDYRVAIT